MQIYQTLECLAYWDIHDEIFCDGAPLRIFLLFFHDTCTQTSHHWKQWTVNDTWPLRNVCQHVENCGEPRSLHPTWCHQNQTSEIHVLMSVAAITKTAYEFLIIFILMHCILLDLAFILLNKSTFLHLRGLQVETVSFTAGFLVFYRSSEW